MNILVLCIANYCRSPVAEFILRDKLGKNFSVNSAGVSPFFLAKMDPRSRDYLQKNGYESLFHSPKIVTSKMIDSADIIFVMDQKIIDILRRQHKGNIENKVKLFNFLDLSIDISDPYKLKSLDLYNKQMMNIDFLCEQIRNYLKKDGKENAKK